jgi:hypothetical protein
MSSSVISTQTSCFGIQDEYNTLREELLQAKKYIFERPLVIVALGVGGINLVPGAYMALLPLVLSGVLLYNFWFTANRIMSAARIIAYIQLELEEHAIGNWVGWETCLRYYRKWLKLDPDEKVKDISKEMDADAVPDAMTFYPSIYRLHIILMVSTLLIAIVVSIYNLSIVNVLCTIGAAVVLYYFRPYTQKYDPEWARSLSERNRIIWIYVFKYMVCENKK